MNRNNFILLLLLCASIVGCTPSQSKNLPNESSITVPKESEKISSGDSMAKNKDNISTESYEVIQCIDGDTIKILYQGKKQTVRLLQIDTPESNHADIDKNVPLGKVASQFTKDFIQGKKVRLEFDVEKFDRYDRMLCYVYVDDKCLNEELIRAGLAMVLKRHPNIAKYEAYKEIETEVRKQKIGIWQDIKANYPEKNIPKEYLTDEDSEIQKEESKNDTKSISEQSKKLKIKGNKKSKIYHLPDGADYNKISPENVIYFDSESEAKKAGYRKAKH